MASTSDRSARLFAIPKQCRFRSSSTERFSVKQNLNGTPAHLAMQCPDTNPRSIWEMNTGCKDIRFYPAMWDTIWVHELEHGNIKVRLGRDSAEFDLKKQLESMTDTSIAGLRTAAISKITNIAIRMYILSVTYLDYGTAADNYYSSYFTWLWHNPGDSVWRSDSALGAYKSKKVS